jgi:hypothetical protein
MITAPLGAPFPHPKDQPPVSRLADTPRGTSATFTPTRQLNVTSPTASNIAAVLASFFADLCKRGVNKST